MAGPYGGAEHAPLGDDGRDQAGRGDVEGRVAGRNALRRDEPPEDAHHLVGAALLDGDARAGGERRVEGAPGCRHVERDVVVAGQHGQPVGPDLVGHVAVRGDAVGPHHHAGDLPAGHEPAGHPVGEDGDGDAVPLELPGGEARPLEERAGLVGEDVLEPSRLPGGPHDPERGPVGRGGQRAGVAVGEHAGLGRQERRPQRPDAAAGGLVLVADGVGLGQHGRGRLADPPRHAPHRPFQVHRRGARPGQQLRRRAQPLRRGAAAGLDREAVGGGHPDGRRSPHRERADGVGDLLGGGEGEPGLLAGQEPLVEEPDLVLPVVVEHRTEHFTFRHRPPPRLPSRPEARRPK